MFCHKKNKEMYNYIKKLLDVIEYKGITKKEFIEKVGWSEAGFYRAIKTNSFKFSDIVSFCTVLGVPVGELLNESPLSRIEDAESGAMVQDPITHYGKNESEILFGLVGEVKTLKNDVEILKKKIDKL
jgi:hypothetical protein